MYERFHYLAPWFGHSLIRHHFDIYQPLADV